MIRGFVPAFIHLGWLGDSAQLLLASDVSGPIKRLWSVMAASCGLILDVLELVILLYSELDAKPRFSWHCPTLCLFSELPSVDVIRDVIEPDAQSPWTPPSSSECIPLVVDALKRLFSGVCIVHHNVQGIHSKMDDLTSWFNVCSGKNVVLCSTEIWLTPASPPLNVPGYQIFTSPLHRRP